MAEIVVLALMLRRNMWRMLPLFCVYIAWGALTDITNAAVLYKMPAAFNRTYFMEMGPDSLLQFGVLIELAWSVLRPSRKLLPRGALPVLAGLVALAGLIIWPLAGTTVPPNLSPHAQLFVHFQETIAILRVVCFLVMAGFSQILSIGWKDRELQVATGLGFFSIISLLVAVLHSHQLWQDASYTWLDRAASISYLGTLTYWVVSFATKEQQRKEFSPQMQQFLLLMGGGARAGRIALSDLPSERPRKRIK
ncbi:MAG TPA: hypothetical protein VHZ52_03415 [Acidobacteriaceae bacterium]|nr:hypothetical protein [Acidobacteriaceae bacterium]